MKPITAASYFLITVSAVILALSVFFRHDIIRNRKLIISLTHNTDMTARKLYTENSLRNAEIILKNKLSSLMETEDSTNIPDLLSMTDKILYLTRKHGLSITDYRLSGTRLKIKTNGKADGITGLIYDLSFPSISKTGGRLTFMSVQSESKEGTITLTAEISCE